METMTYYQWKLPTLDENGDPLWIIPRADPWQHEFPIDFMFDTQEAAKEFLTEWEIEKEESDKWILVKVIEEKVED